MGYKSAIDLIGKKVAKAKANLFFVIATDKEFNSDDNRDYPVVWVRKPITSTKIKNANNIFIQETFSFEIQVLQKCKFTDRTDLDANIQRYFQETNYILVALLNDLLMNDVAISTGTSSEVYKKGDLITIGWRQPVTITVDVDSDLCCSFFHD